MLTSLLSQKGGEILYELLQYIQSHNFGVRIGAVDNDCDLVSRTNF